jgi:hypothetical protein
VIASRALSTSEGTTRKLGIAIRIVHVERRLPLQVNLGRGDEGDPRILEWPPQG